MAAVTDIQAPQARASHAHPILRLVRRRLGFGVLTLFLVSVVIFLVGHAWFYKLRKSFADII